MAVRSDDMNTRSLISKRFYEICLNNQRFMDISIWTVKNVRQIEIFGIEKCPYTLCPISVGFREQFFHFKFKNKQSESGSLIAFFCHKRTCEDYLQKQNRAFVFDTCIRFYKKMFKSKVIVITGKFFTLSNYHL